MFAVKIVQRLQKGDLITSLDDKRIYQESDFSALDKVMNVSRKIKNTGSDIISTFNEHTSNIKNKVDEMFQRHEENLKRKKQEQKSSGPVRVRAYTKKDGTDVKSHYRSR